MSLAYSFASSVKVFLQAADRRDRLIYVLSQINAARGDDAMHMDDAASEDSEEEVFRDLCCSLCHALIVCKGEEFYTPGSLELLQARRDIAEYSLPRLAFAPPGEDCAAYYVFIPSLHSQGSKAHRPTASG